MRNLHNALTCDGGTLSAHPLGELFLSLKSLGNKGWVRSVPAAAVIPAAQVVAVFTGLEASVAGLVRLWLNPQA